MLKTHTTEKRYVQKAKQTLLLHYLPTDSHFHLNSFSLKSNYSSLLSPHTHMLMQDMKHTHTHTQMQITQAWCNYCSLGKFYPYPSEKRPVNLNCCWSTIINHEHRLGSFISVVKQSRNQKMWNTHCDPYRCCHRCFVNFQCVIEKRRERHFLCNTLHQTQQLLYADDPVLFRSVQLWWATFGWKQARYCWSEWQ